MVYVHLSPNASVACSSSQKSRACEHRQYQRCSQPLFQKTTTCDCKTANAGAHTRALRRQHRHVRAAQVRVRHLQHLVALSTGRCCPRGRAGRLQGAGNAFSIFLTRHKCGLLRREARLPHQRQQHIEARGALKSEAAAPAMCTARLSAHPTLGWRSKSWLRGHRVSCFGGLPG